MNIILNNSTYNYITKKKLNLLLTNFLVLNNQSSFIFERLFVFNLVQRLSVRWNLQIPTSPKKSNF